MKQKRNRGLTSIFSTKQKSPRLSKVEQRFELVGDRVRKKRCSLQITAYRLYARLLVLYCRVLHVSLLAFVSTVALAWFGLIYYLLKDYGGKIFLLPLGLATAICIVGKLDPELEFRLGHRRWEILNEKAIAKAKFEATCCLLGAECDDYLRRHHSGFQ